MMLRLRCIRCGDLADMDPRWGWGICAWCYQSRPRLRPIHAYKRWLRWRKGEERHPTYKALTAALDAMASTPHGELAEVTL